MEITVTLFGALRHHLPPGSAFNKCELSLADDASLADLLAALPLPADTAYMVLLNDEKMQADDYASIPVSADDTVVLLPPIKGG